ncbi:hypothetical protein C7447_101368 [Tenacibaculum adriaticum]|uniref:GDSL-like lipase/acylhydrolase family protein n=1 Tax=Tenacibaculum adriaticum TaxID=413713 RepID=A0A5S5DVL5_9FLAO|nr:G-D-S-L family lipolytic protein [Tenacibaculum adriaticum]TYP99764.1 hypothetical protein C7447_101368 [Tenacibaculum adriaticum]
MKFKYSWLPVLFLGLTACDINNDLDPIPEDPATAVVELNGNGIDFSTYVSIGASFTAGFTDNALFIAGQENSFPNILAEKFAMVGGGAFTQPLMSDNFGGLILGGQPVINPATQERLFTERLIFNGEGPAPLASVNPAAMSTTDFALNNPTGPFNNLGVPGAKSFHLIAPGYGNLANFPTAANPYAIRVSGNTDTSIIGLAVSQNPTFFTLSEFGGNDVLGYAISGGDGSDLITPTATFDFALENVTAALVTTGAKGVIANLPYITNLPHFTTVPYNPVPLDLETATALNQGYATYNGGIQAALAALTGTGLFTEEEATKRMINFEAGEGNAMVIIDENLTDLGAINPAFAALPKYRQATKDDLFVLPLSSFIPQGYGTQIALEDKWVLTPQEQIEIKTATDAYNLSLKTTAEANGYAFVDLNSLLQQASTSGIAFDSYVLSANLVTGGLVGLDGVHLTARGYALMANKMLEAIDSTYGSNFGKATNGLAKANDFPTNYSPALQ